jgi:hypothetical protein
MEVKGSKAQGRFGDGRSEGSAEQRREPMNKNRMRHMVSGELANDSEAHIHQRHWV